MSCEHNGPMRMNVQTPMQRATFIEETCNCGRTWRGKVGTRPADGCPDCGAEAENVKISESLHGFDNYALGYRVP